MRLLLVERARQGRRRVPHRVVDGRHRGRRGRHRRSRRRRPTCSRPPAPRSRPVGLTATVGQLRRGDRPRDGVGRRDLGPRPGPPLAVPRPARPAAKGRRPARLARALVAVGACTPSSPQGNGWRCAPRTPSPRRSSTAAARRCSPPHPVVTVLLDRRGRGQPVDGGGRAGHGARPDRPGDHARRRSPTGRRRPPTDRATPSPCCAQADYLRVKNAIHDLPGVRFTSAQRLLAPDAGFASQVLPAVRTRGRCRSWTARRAGRCSPSTARATRSRRSSRRRRARARTVATGLDLAIQTAAEDAVEPVAQPTVLVAVAPSTGDILAVAQNGPADAAGAISLDRALPAGLDVQDGHGDGRGRGPAPHRRLAGAVPRRHRHRRSAGAQRGRVRPRHRAAAHGVRQVVQHDVRAAGRAAAARRAAQRRAAAGAGRRLPRAWPDDGHRLRAAVRPTPCSGPRTGSGRARCSRRPLGMALAAATVARGAHGRAAAHPRPSHRGAHAGDAARPAPRSTSSGR